MTAPDPEVTRVNPPHLEFPGMSQGVLSGEFLNISGQVALGSDGQLVGEGDIEAQVEQCFLNLHAVLDAAGLRMRHLVKYTCYLTDPAHYPALAAAKAKHLDGEPSCSTVVVPTLLDPRMLVEIEAVAFTGTGQG
jgi:enamine deaminase RidA (YjgF/YER057c/UK114 family)